MFEFTIRPNLNVGACCADEEYRFLATEHVLAAGTALYATNGRVLSVLPIGVGPEKPTLLSADSLKGTTKREVSISVNGEVRRTAGKTVNCFPLPVMDGRFPPVGQVMPEITDEYLMVRLNAKQLSDLASAISPERDVVLFIPPGEGKPIAVIGFDEGDKPLGIGAFMPLKVPERREALVTHYNSIVSVMPKDSIRFETAKEEAA
jgi:hypothetical protein